MNLGFSQGLTQQWAVITTLVCGFLLCAALFMEHVMGLAPCPLCMMQRLWIAIVGLIIYASLLHNPRLGIYPLLGMLASIVGGGFSIRQLWLQSLPADQVPACGPDLQYMLEAFPLSDVLVAMTSGTGDCATVSWSLLGISIPGYVLAGFVVLFVLCFAQLKAGFR
ncbi:MAG: disulfide bond formation protein B [Pseudomonadaceae bacterium]|nr:disulfide bond formation protein B [Pseudomonadaceae bacterium]